MYTMYCIIMPTYVQTASMLFSLVYEFSLALGNKTFYVFMMMKDVLWICMCVVYRMLPDHHVLKTHSLTFAQ